MDIVRLAPRAGGERVCHAQLLGPPEPAGKGSSETETRDFHVAMGQNPVPAAMRCPSPNRPILTPRFNPDSVARAVQAAGKPPPRMLRWQKRLRECRSLRRSTTSLSRQDAGVFLTEYWFGAQNTGQNGSCIVSVARGRGLLPTRATLSDFIGSGLSARILGAAPCPWQRARRGVVFRDSKGPPSSWKAITLQGCGGGGESSHPL